MNKSTYKKNVIPVRLVGNKSIKSDTNEDTRKGVQSVDQAFHILSVFEKSDRPLAIKELAEALDMPASKIHHYLVSLVRSKVLRQTVDGAYDLGSFALHLGLSAMRKLEPIERAATAARSLRDSTGEAVFISVWGSFGPTIIRYYEGFQPVTVEIRAGLVLPLATSATGKVFLSWGAEASMADTIKREKISKSFLKETKQETIKNGLGSVEGELLPRISSLSAPVFDKDNRLALSLTMLGWMGEFEIELDSQNATALLGASQALSSELGHSK